MIIRLVFENVNIDFLFWYILSEGIEIIKRITRIIHIYVFFVFIVSLDERDAVYINNVIIPEENVRITTNAIHLEIDLLNTIIDEIIEIKRM